jgi:WD40 repeat protein
MYRALILVPVLLADVTPRGDVFRPESARLVGTLKVGTSPVASLSYTRDSRRMVVLTTDGTLLVWDIATRREIRRMPGKFFVSRIHLSADGTRALGVSSDKRSVRLVDLEKGEDIRSFPDIQSGTKQTYALSPDGRRAAVVRRDLSVRIFEGATGEEVRTLIDPATRQGGSLVWSSDGKIIAVHGWDGMVRTFDVNSGDLTGSIPDMGPSPRFLGYSPDSANLVVVASDSRIRMFDRTGRELRALEDTLSGSCHIAFSHNGLLMAGAEVSGRVRIWDARTWRRLRDLDAEAVRHLAFSPDGRHLAMATEDGVKLWGGSGPPVAAPKIEAPRAGAPGFLGIQANTDEDEEAGVVIESILAGTAAERAGLKAGDRIIKIAGSATENFEALKETVTTLREGDEVEVVYRRDGEEKKVKVKLGSRPPE